MRVVFYDDSFGSALKISFLILIDYRDDYIPNLSIFGREYLLNFLDTFWGKKLGKSSKSRTRFLVFIEKPISEYSYLRNFEYQLISFHLHIPTLPMDNRSTHQYFIEPNELLDRIRVDVSNQSIKKSVKFKKLKLKVSGWSQRKFFP